MTALPERIEVMAMVAEAVKAGARQDRACAAISFSERTLQRWQRDGMRGDQRPARVQMPTNRLSALERGQLLAVANSDEFASLPPSQIVPRLVDQGVYLASESTFYRVLKAEKQLVHRSAECPAQARHKPRALMATARGRLYSWDITYLPTPGKGIYFPLARPESRGSRPVLRGAVGEIPMVYSPVCSHPCKNPPCGDPDHQRQVDFLNTLEIGLCPRKTHAEAEYVASRRIFDRLCPL